METKYKLSIDRSEISKMFFPTEKRRLVILSSGMAAGMVSALIVLLLTFIAYRIPDVKQLTDILEMIYVGYSIDLDITKCCSPSNMNILLAIIYGFSHGFLFGVLLTFIYNLLRSPYQFGVKLKNAGEITGSNQPVVISKGESSADKPFTIAIIANPVLESQAIPSSAKDKERYKKDPILQYPELFQMKVAFIIGSLATNDMIRDEFLKNMRIITLFKPELSKSEPPANALCMERASDTILEPRQRVPDPDNEGGFKERLTRFLKEELGDNHYHPTSRPIDVVFVISASEKNTRSAAYYTIDDEPKGQPFTFKYLDPEQDFNGLHHAPYPDIPGMVALNAWENRLRAPLHEFAHAASSTTNGFVVDEYADYVPEDLEGRPIINKHQRKTADAITPSEFAEYNGNKYYTDQSRVTPSGWKSFVPAREDFRIACTMDRTYDRHKFDVLIEDFLRDRLDAKHQRTEEA